MTTLGPANDAEPASLGGVRPRGSALPPWVASLPLAEAGQIGIGRQ